MSAIAINAILRAKPGKAHELREELVKMIGPSRAEKGCIEYTLHESAEDPGIFVFYEVWKDEESLKEHIETNHYKEYRKKGELLVETREVYRLQKVVL